MNVIPLRLVPGIANSRIGHLLARVGLVGLLKRIFTEHQVSHVLDVGANLGQYVSFLRKHVGYRGAITSFEPTSSAFETLEAIRDPALKVLQLALGASDTDADINVMVGSDLSSLHAPSTEWTKEFSHRNKVSRVERVSVRRLDGLGVVGPCFLKIDTQGHELAVLDGAAGMLERVVACQIEIPCVRLYEGGPTTAESLEYMTDHGFDLCGLFPVTTISHDRVTDLDSMYLLKSMLWKGYAPRVCGGLG